MQACTTISKLVFVAILTLAILPAQSFAQGGGTNSGVTTGGNALDSGFGPGAIPDASGPAIPSGQKKEDSNLFDSGSPYLNYGDFDMTKEENDDALYFQYGRFFGISLGLGYETALGSRGKVYQAAIPRFDLRIHYWFDFNFAMDLGVFFANHSFTYSSVPYTAKLLGYGVHFIYYFDTRDSSAVLSFANPFIEAGAGQWSLSQNSPESSTGSADQWSTFSADFGGGFEFPVVYKKTYVGLEALYHSESFGDSLGTTALSGGFFTMMVHFMFVW